MVSLMLARSRMAKSRMASSRLAYTLNSLLTPMATVIRYEQICS